MHIFLTYLSLRRLCSIGPDDQRVSLLSTRTITIAIIALFGCV